MRAASAGLGAPGAASSGVSVERIANPCLPFPWPRRHCRPLFCAPHPPPPPPPPPCPVVFEAAECRILLNRLQREIDRLRLGLDEYCHNQTTQPIVFEAGRCDELSTDRAERSHDRPPYAPAPIGKIEPDNSPKYESRPIFLNRYPVITNLGTLVDVLM